MRRKFLWLVTALCLAIAALALLAASLKSLTEREAAALGARIANAKCDSRFGEQPFKAEHYAAWFNNGRWHWGEYDPAGIDGYSAKVSFDEDGGDRKCEVYFSTDKLDLPDPPDPTSVDDF